MTSSKRSKLEELIKSLIVIDFNKFKISKYSDSDKKINNKRIIGKIITKLEKLKNKPSNLTDDEIYNSLKTLIKNKHDDCVNIITTTDRYYEFDKKKKKYTYLIMNQPKKIYTII